MILPDRPEHFTCPVCDYAKMPWPAKDYNICEQCGVEFGNEEESMYPAIREAWEKAGRPFWRTSVEWQNIINTLALPSPVPQQASEHFLRNLLAVIHRDGGHYTSKHGLSKAASSFIQPIPQSRTQSIKGDTVPDPQPSRKEFLDKVRITADKVRSQPETYKNHRVKMSDPQLPTAVMPTSIVDVIAEFVEGCKVVSEGLLTAWEEEHNLTIDLVLRQLRDPQETVQLIADLKRLAGAADEKAMIALHMAGSAIRALEGLPLRFSLCKRIPEFLKMIDEEIENNGN